MTTLADLAQEEFVLLTTFRRSGVGVSVPVWIAAEAGTDAVLLVTTTERSGKVKRLRHDRRLELQACDRHGTVTDGAASLAARAEIITAPGEVRRLRTSIRAKYGSRMRTTEADLGQSASTEPARAILRISDPSADL